MKKNLLLFTFLTIGASLFAQSEKEFFDYLVQKDFTQAEKYLDTDLNLCILDFDQMVNKNQAISQIRSFFIKNDPISYSIKHTGNSKGGQSTYFVAELRTSGGNFRMFAYFDTVGNSFKISEFRIEP